MVSRTFWSLPEGMLLVDGFQQGLSDSKIAENLKSAGFRRSSDSVWNKRQRLGLIRANERRRINPANHTPLLVAQRDHRSEDKKFKIAMLAALEAGQEHVICGVVKDHRPFALKTVAVPETFVPSMSALMNG